jgi:hypothetical protein
MTVTDGDLVERMAIKHSVSPAAAQVVLAALRSGGGKMAQFSHADFDGMSQWSPGMTMVGVMFNGKLKTKLDALCSDLAAQLEASPAPGGTRSAGGEVSFRSMSGSTDWWPAGLGRTGAVKTFGTPFFPKPVVGDRRPRSNHGLRHRISPDFRCRAGPEQRPDPLVHQLGRTGQGHRPAESCRVTVPPRPARVQKSDPGGAKPALTPFRHPRRLRRRLRGRLGSSGNERSGTECADD